MQLLQRMGDVWGTSRRLVNRFRQHYSTTAVHTGHRTISGDEIYRKQLAVSVGPESGGEASVPHGEVDLATVVRICGVLRSGTTERMINSNDGTCNLSAVRVANDIVLTSGDADLSEYTGEVVIEFTKS